MIGMNLKEYLTTKVRKKVLDEGTMNEVKFGVFVEFMLERFPNEQSTSYIQEWLERFQFNKYYLMDRHSREIFLNIVVNKKLQEHFGVWKCLECNEAKLPSEISEEEEEYCEDCQAERERARAEARADELRGK